MDKGKAVSIGIPAFVSSAMTLFMYIGEMILLHGHLYSFGKGFIFDSISGMVLAPIDVMIIIVSGCLSALFCALLNSIAIGKTVR